MLPSEELEELVERIWEHDIIVKNSQVRKQFHKIIGKVAYMETYLECKGENHLLDQVRWVDDGF